MNNASHQLDLMSDPGGPGTRRGDLDGGFLGVTFDCCRVYSRLYRNRAGDAYEGRCPKCLRHLRVGICPGGTNQRFFTAS